MSNIETSMSAGESTGTDLASGLDQNGSTDQQQTTAPEITKTGAEATDQRHLPGPHPLLKARISPRGHAGVRERKAG